MIRIAGLVPFTTIDFPQRLSAVIFLQGCPLRCPFCHNPHLQPTDVQTDLNWKEIISFLKDRQKKLDGVVFSGGEPLMQSNIEQAMQEVRDMGFQIAVHTAGIYPERLEYVLPLVDWVGLDIKAPAAKYDILTGREAMYDKVQKSLSLLLKAQKSFEVRTTADPRFLTPDDIYTLARELKEQGVKTYALQKYRSFDLEKNPPQQFEIDRFFVDEALMLFLKEAFPSFCVR